MEHQDGKVGKYTIVSKIGDGGMAEVFVGHVRGEGDFEKVVAIKKILPNLASNERFRRNFINEARICAKLHHHNIVEVYDFIQEGHDLYLVMEHIDGLTLEDIFAYHREVEQQVTTDIIFAIMFQLLEGLEYAHSATDPITKEPLNVIHRDLKPSNILIDDRGMVKIVDFGVAKAAIKRYETQEFTAKGSPSYMAPEQILGNTEVTQSSDVFAAGSIFYELLTLDRLFDGANVFAILKQVATLDINKHLEATIQGADRRFLNVLKKSLAREVEERYQKAGEMFQELGNMFHGVLNRRRLADHLRKIRNLDENVEDAATRLVTDVDAILAEYETVPGQEQEEAAEDGQATVTAHAEAAEGSQEAEDGAMEGDTISGDTQTIQSTPPEDVGAATLTEPLPPAELSELLGQGSGGTPGDQAEDAGGDTTEQAFGASDGIDRSRLLGAAGNDDGAPQPGDSEVTAPAPLEADTSERRAPPSRTPGARMPSILGGLPSWPPPGIDPHDGEDEADGNIDLADMDDPPPSFPVQVGSLHEAQPSTLAPILFGACIGLVILVVLAILVQ